VLNDDGWLKDLQEQLLSAAARAKKRKKREKKEITDTDLLNFLQDLWIINKEGELVQLALKDSQKYVMDQILEARAKGKPGRFICCKSRQLGISTLIEAFIFSLTTLLPNRFALVVAHSIESSGRIFAMTQRFHRNLPPSQRKPLAKSNARLLQYTPPHYSEMRIDTASNKELGRSATLHYVHLSEVAFWEKPEEPILAINQAVPQIPNSLIFWESTANGMGNLFHRTWEQAVAGKIDMTPIFLPWRGEKEYWFPVEEGEKTRMKEEEQKFVEEYDLCPEEAKWYVYTKNQQCEGDQNKFDQEYPVTAERAFVASGVPFLNQEVIRRWLERAEKPVFRGYLRWKDENEKLVELMEDERGPLSIWEWADVDRYYILAGDISEGVGRDYTSLAVLKMPEDVNEPITMVAKFRSNRINAKAAGRVAEQLGYYYVTALVGIERNGPGHATLCELRDRAYPNLYYQTKFDRRDPEPTERLGWFTGHTPKRMMLQEIKAAVEDEALIIHCRPTLKQMQGLKWDPQKGTHKATAQDEITDRIVDDEIISLAIGLQVLKYAQSGRFFRTITTESL